MTDSDSTMVFSEIIAKAVDNVSSDEDAAFSDLMEREPVLANYIYENTMAIAGGLSLSGAPTEIVRETHQRLTGLLLTALEATRIGHFEVWRDAAEGEHLRRISEQDLPVEPIQPSPDQ